MRERGKWRARAGCATLLVALVLPAQVQAEPPPPPSTISARAARAAAIGADLVLMRVPLALASAVGAVLFVPVFLVTVPMGREGIQEAREMLVEIPFENAFRRRLGDYGGLPARQARSSAGSGSAGSQGSGM